jgi:hypothetical protein
MEGTMRPIFIAKMVVLLLVTFSTPVHAYTKTAAQQCADQLLTAYNTNQYPAQLLDIPSITARAVGSPYTLLSADDQQYLLNMTDQVLRESFVNPSGQYQYRNLIITVTEPLDKGNFRAIGSVYITSPRFTGAATFIALVSPPCLIYQVRINDVATLDGEVRTGLRQYVRARDLMK